MIIGDGACGKTSLLSVFTLGYFPTVSLLSYSLSQQDIWLTFILDDSTTLVPGHPVREINI